MHWQGIGPCRRTTCMRVREAAVMERRRMEKWRSGEAHRSTRSWSCDCMHMRDVDGWNPVSESCIACRVFVLSHSDTLSRGFGNGCCTWKEINQPLRGGLRSGSFSSLRCGIFFMGERVVRSSEDPRIRLESRSQSIHPAPAPPINPGSLSSSPQLL